MVRRLPFLIFLLLGFSILLHAGNNNFAAKINGEIISIKQFNESFQTAKKQIVLQEKLDINSEAGELAILETRKTILDEMINFVLLKQAAKRMNLRITNKEVDARIEEMKKHFPSKREFLNALHEEKIELDDLYQGITHQLLREKITEKLAEKTKVKNREIKQYFKSHRQQFYHPRRIAAHHILLDSREEAETTLEKVLAGKSFEKLAKKYSLDPLSNRSGGDLGFLEPGQMPREFEKTLSKMKPGIISGIVKTEQGYHIIRCDEIIPAKKIDETISEEHIKDFILAEKKRTIFNSWFEELKEDAEIIINPDLFPTYQSQPNSQKSNPTISFNNLG